MNRVRGFTLVEMLVVLLIMGVFLGSIGFSLDRQSRDGLDAQAQQLAAWLNLARERAVLDAVVYGVRQSGDALELVFHHDYAWHAVADVPLWSPAEHVTLKLEVLPEARESGETALVMVFYPGGLVADYSRVWLETAADQMRLAWDAGDALVPQARFERS